MTIQEMAKKWVEIEIINDPILNEPDWEQVKRCMSYVLTSLLEELPEVDELPNNHDSVDIGVRLGAIDYRNEIKSLIQTKLQ